MVPSFGGQQVADQTYTVGVEITALTLPEASGGEGALTYTLSPTVPGLSFDSSARRLSGTPTAAGLGTHTLTYGVTDADGDDASLTFNVSIAPAPPAPPDTAPSFGGQQVADQTYTVGVEITALTLPEASGGEGALTYTLSPTVPGLKFNPEERSLSGTPTTAGAYSMTYEVVDADENTTSDDTATLNFTITVLELPDTKPSFQGTVADQTYTVGEPIRTLTLPAATGGEGDLSYTLVPRVPGLKFNPEERSLSGTPTTTGAYSMTYEVVDSDENTTSDDAATLNFTITVLAPSQIERVSIPDSNLRSAIEHHLGKAPDAPIYAHEMATLKSIDTWYFDSRLGRMIRIYDSGGISSLEGIQFATNLEVLDIDSNYWDEDNRQWINLNDLSDLTPLADLSKLTVLNLSGSNDIIRDLSPLSGLSNLKEFYCWNCAITDLMPLSYLTVLTKLFLGSNDHLADLSPLSSLYELTHLSLYYNSIADITSLAGLVNLEYLILDVNDITDFTSLSGLYNLQELSVVANPASDITPLSGLANLKHLSVGGYQFFEDITPLSQLTGLHNLYIYGYRGSGPYDLSPLSGLTELVYFRIRRGEVSDVSPLSGLTELTWLDLRDNLISNIAALVDNAGLGNGDEVDLTENPLSSVSLHTHIPALQARGVDVSFSEPPDIVVTVDGDPLIYNDNVFVLPVEEPLAAGRLPLQEYATRFYEKFEDAFDFLILISNLDFGESNDPLGTHYFVRNDVLGIGLPVSSSASWGSGNKLQSVLGFSYYYAMANGPTLHEMTHRWANYIVGNQQPHWGFTSADGQLGGFDIANLVDHGDGRYTAGDFTTAGYALNIQPFSAIELYLAGLIPPEEVPDLWVAEDGKALRDGDGNIVVAENGFPMFTASRVRTYTIEDIIAEHGPRDPDHSSAQTEFRAAAILLIDRDNPATREILETVSNNISWFSYRGMDEYSQTFNFYEATGGRASITMNELSQFQLVSQRRDPVVRGTQDWQRRREDHAIPGMTGYGSEVYLQRH